LKEAITASGQYRFVSSLDDEGKLDLVHTIYMTCAENNDVTAVATLRALPVLPGASSSISAAALAPIVTPARHWEEPLAF
jgi:hypothetical protein